MRLALLLAALLSLAAPFVPVARVTLGARTLHPLLLANTYVWERESGCSQRIGREHGIEQRPDYLESPLRPVYENRETVRRRLTGPAITKIWR